MPPARSPPSHHNVMPHRRKSKARTATREPDKSHTTRRTPTARTSRRQRAPASPFSNSGNRPARDSRRRAGNPRRTSQRFRFAPPAISPTIKSKPDHRPYRREGQHKSSAPSRQGLEQRHRQREQPRERERQTVRWEIRASRPSSAGTGRREKPISGSLSEKVQPRPRGTPRRAVPVRDPAPPDGGPVGRAQ